jgi:C4-dicarboxylate-specific signal transduction histidine kinase
MTTEILHEIGQPLTAIASFSDASLRTLRRDHSDQEQIIEYVGEIKNQAARARDIVRKLQRFLRSGRPSEAPVEVNRLVRAALRFMEGDLEAQRITVDLRLMPELCIISADRILLEQVLVNLIRNAIEAMAGIDLASRRLILRTRHLAHQVMITVSDSGQGIPAALREKIFQPFFTTNPKGFGMGLAISRSILEAHGGRLRAANRCGGGATFRISLPVNEG